MADLVEISPDFEDRYIPDGNVTVPAIPVKELKKWQLFNAVDEELLGKIRLAHVFGVHPVTGIFVTTDDQVYSIGSNGSGCLGIGADQPTFSFFPLKVDVLCGTGVTAFSSGGDYWEANFCFAITKSGKIYSWGWNDHGQLGLGNSAFTKAPTLVDMKDQVVKSVACGKSFTLIVTTDGSVYGSGMNASSELGLGSTTNQNLPEQVILPDGIKILTASVGEHHSCALAENGEVFVFGYNAHGQLGNRKVANVAKPLRHEIVSVKKALAGYNHTVLLTTNGELYSFGQNDFGQLGNGTGQNSSIPIRSQISGFVEDIACLRNCSACKVQGEFYVWGQIHEEPTKVACSSFHDLFATFTSPQVMHEQLEVNERSENSSLLLDLENSLYDALDSDNKSEYDVEFVVEGKTIRAHKTILIIRSAYFATRFSGVWKDQGGSSIRMPDGVKCKPFWALLHYFYTDKIYFSCSDYENVLDLMVFADSFCETKLCAKCEDILQKHIKLKNVFEFYVAASKCNANGLKQKAFNFAVLNWKEIAATGLLTNSGLGLNDYPLFLEACAKLKLN